jgi:excisionase family DNA binding protein
MSNLAQRQDSQETFVDLSSAAARLGVSRKTANKLVLERRLPARRWGQQWMVDKADLERFAEYFQPDPRKIVKSPLDPERLRDAMTIIYENPGITLAELAQRVGRARRTVLDWMQLLDREGLVDRRRGWDSKDPAACFLTKAGEAFVTGEEAPTTP